MYKGTDETGQDVWRQLKGVDRECFGCGAENHSGLKMSFATNGEKLRSIVTLDKRFRGWSNLIHGGVISTILDETMGWTVITVVRKFMLTKGMQVSFKKPIRIGMTVTATGYIKERINDRALVVVAEIYDESGDLCASSEGEFVLFEREQFLRMKIMPEEDMATMEAAMTD